ncbi:hypothetical protein F25303_7202 [Fusarium sp. NRRL 25303]|nr:hypothetical protein F25303_7202 [Fusarium sp. NRRL 25303]
MSDKFKLDLIATDAYTRAHGETLFTHMKMIDRQLTSFKILYDDFVVSPRLSLEHNTRSDYLKLVDDHGVQDLSSSGACTVLAIRACTALQKKYPSKYDFKIKVTARGFVEDLTSIPFKEGLATCLWEVADSADLVTLFRFTSPSGKRYTRAKIQWVIGEDNHKLPSAKYRNLMRKTTDKNPKRVVWKEGIRGYQDRTGTPSTNIEA